MREFVFKHSKGTKSIFDCNMHRLTAEERPVARWISPRTQNVNPLGGVCLAEWTVGASNDPIRVTTIIFVKYWFFSPTSDNQSNNKPLFALNNFPISKFVFNCLPLFVLYLNRGLAFAIDFQLPLSLDKYPDVSSRAASMVQSDGPERDGW